MYFKIDILIYLRLIQIFSYEIVYSRFSEDAKNSVYVLAINSKEFPQVMGDVEALMTRVSIVLSSLYYKCDKRVYFSLSLISNGLSVAAPKQFLPYHSLFFSIVQFSLRILPTNPSTSIQRINSNKLEEFFRNWKPLRLFFSIYFVPAIW